MRMVGGLSYPFMLGQKGGKAQGVKAEGASLFRNV
jgi:hypothetical protein